MKYLKDLVRFSMVAFILLWIEIFFLIILFTEFSITTSFIIISVLISFFILILKNIGDFLKNYEKFLYLTFSGFLILMNIFLLITYNQNSINHKNKIVQEKKDNQKKFISIEKELVEITKDADIFFFNNTIPKVKIGTVQKGDIFYIFEKDVKNYYLAFTYKVPLSRTNAKIISSKNIPFKKVSEKILREYYKDNFLAYDCARVYTEQRYPYRTPEKLDKHYYSKIDYERFLQDSYKLKTFKKYFGTYNDLFRKQILKMGDEGSWPYGTIEENDLWCKNNDY